MAFSNKLLLINFERRILVYREKNVYKTRNILLELGANAGRAARTPTVIFENCS